MSAAIESHAPGPKTVNIAIIAGQLVVGGAERQLYLWLANLDRERYQPIVITLHPGHDDYWEGPIEALNIPLVRIPQRRNRFLRLYEIIKILRPHQPELVHGWHLFASAYAGLAAKALGAKSIGGVRNNYQSFKSNKLTSFITLQTVDALVANSASTAMSLENHINPKRQRIYAVQNAIEDCFFDRHIMRERLVNDYNLPHDALWIGSIGRLDPLKRFDWLLQIMAKIRDERHDMHLLLIGDGPERSRLENISEVLELADEVTFTGEVPMASTWLKALDIFAFTSVDEGMPNVVLEAAAAGLPIVTWDLPFIQELLTHNHTALLVDAGHLDQMINALKSLIESSELRTTLGQAAQSHILDSFNLDPFIQKMTAVYESVLSS